MFESPCTNHKNNGCPLDLKALRVATKNGSSDPKAWDRMQEAEKKLRDLTAQKAEPSAIAAAKSDYEKASRAWRDACDETSALGRTVLYTIRAHHRGRLHGSSRRESDGKKVAWTKELQADFLESPFAQRLLAKFLKKSETKPQNVA